MFTDSILIKRLIVTEYQLKPLAQLRDYYKLFFQSFYGPGHLISDKETAFNFLEEEMKELEKITPPVNMPHFRYIQDITYETGYSRVSLELVRKGVLTIPELCDIFVLSANGSQAFDEFQWVKAWNEIQNTIKSMSFFKDKLLPKQYAEIQEKIDKKEFVLSHSDLYRRAYKPHYRVVRNDLLSPIL